MDAELVARASLHARLQSYFTSEGIVEACALAEIP